MKKYKNIFTGEEVDNYFEAFGYKKFMNDRSLNVELNDKKFDFIYETNIEYKCDDLRFVVCSRDNEKYCIAFNKNMKNHERYRMMFKDGLEYLYSLNINRIWNLYMTIIAFVLK